MRHDMLGFNTAVHGNTDAACENINYILRCDNRSYEAQFHRGLPRQTRCLIRNPRVRRNSSYVCRIQVYLYCPSRKILKKFAIRKMHKITWKIHINRSHKRGKKQTLICAKNVRKFAKVAKIGHFCLESINVTIW